MLHFVTRNHEKTWQLKGFDLPNVITKVQCVWKRKGLRGAAITCSCSPHCAPSFSRVKRTSEFNKITSGWRSEVAPWNINALNVQPTLLLPCFLAQPYDYAHLLLLVPSAPMEKLVTRVHQTPVITFLRAKWGSLIIESGSGAAQAVSSLLPLSARVTFKQWNQTARWDRTLSLSAGDNVAHRPDLSDEDGFYLRCRKQVPAAPPSLSLECFGTSPITYFEKGKERWKLPTFCERLACKHWVIFTLWW